MEKATSISFHPAAPVDIPLIQDLSCRIWREHYPGIISPAQIDYMLERMYATTTLQAEMEKQGYQYVLVSDRDEPVGYLAFRHDPREAAVLLSKIYLLPSLHGKGLGQRMLDQVRREAMHLGARIITLFVNRNNTKAIRAYERFGFLKTEEVVTDIGGGFGMDDYRMELSL